MRCNWIHWFHFIFVAIVGCCGGFAAAEVSADTGTLSQLIPLTAVTVNGLFYDSLGKVAIAQRWHNPVVRNATITGSYKFSLDMHAVVCGLKMKIGNATWTGHVKEKRAAHEEYTAAVNAGIKSSLLEQLSDNDYQINVGPIPPGQDVEIIIQYLCQAGVRTDGTYQFVLPTNIAQKYVGAPTGNTIDDEYGARMSSVPYTSRPGYTFDVDIKWTTGGSLVNVASPTNGIEVEMLNSKAARIRCKTAPENGDFKLQVKAKESIGAYSYTNASDGSTILYINNRIPAEVAPRADKRMITIMIDRSGSMSGHKMQHAVEAVDAFLSLLPTNGSIFINVVSFGTTYQPMFSHAVPATVELVSTMRKSVRAYDATFGGTELLACLEDVVEDNFKVAPACDEIIVPETDDSWTERIIVLLTDGQVSNLNSILAMLKRRRQKGGDTRIMTIGIGHDGDRSLVQQIADGTSGICKVLADEMNVTSALIDILGDIDKRYFTDVRVLGGYETVQTSKVLYPSQPIDFFLRLDKEQYLNITTTGFDVAAYDPVHHNNKVWTIAVDKIVNNVSLLTELYANLVIKEMRKRQDFEDNTRIVELSLAHGIINPLTSFIIISDDNTDADDLQNVEVSHHRYAVNDASSSGITLLTGRSARVSTGFAASRESTMFMELSSRMTDSFTGFVDDCSYGDNIPTSNYDLGTNVIQILSDAWEHIVGPIDRGYSTNAHVMGTKGVIVMSAADLTGGIDLEEGTVGTATTGVQDVYLQGPPKVANDYITVSEIDSTGVVDDLLTISTASREHSLVPLVQQPTQLQNGSCTTHFGYISTTGAENMTQVLNAFSPSLADRGQPQDFLLGVHDDFFTVTHPCDEKLAWYLGNYTCVVSNHSASCGLVDIVV
jgi:hypothetical protein